MEQMSINNNEINNFLNLIKNLDNNKLEDKKIIKIKSIYLINSYLNNSIKKKEKKERFYSLYLDFIISRFKYSYISGIQKIELNDMDTYLAKDIAYDCEKLIEKEYNEFNIEYQKIVFKLFLFYDFIFYKKFGIFTKFKSNKKLFEIIKTDLTSNFKAHFVENMEKDIIKELLKIHINYYNFKCNNNNIYETIINLAKDGKIVLIEPFTYFLYSKLLYYYYISNYYNKSDNNKIKYQRNKKKYLNDHLQIINDFYNSSITNKEFYLKIYEIDKNFFKNIIEN